MGKSIDNVIQEVLEKKLSDGSFEQVISDKIDEAIGNAVKEAFSWSSPAYKEVKEKVSVLMCKSLERSNFEDYTCKVTEVINVALKNSNLFNYKTVLNNLNELLDHDKDVEYGQEVTLESIFDRYNSFIEEYYQDKKYLFNDSDIEEDSESEHGWATVYTMMNIEECSSRYNSYKDYKITMSCNRAEQEPDTTVEFKLSKDRTGKVHFSISVETDWRISDIRDINRVQLYLLKLKQNWAKITADQLTIMREITEEEICVDFTED
jgi:hypothetical protein